MFDCWQPFGWTRLLLILKILFWLKRIWASNRNLRRSLFTFYVTGRLRFFRVTEFMTLFAIVCFIVHQLLCTACARSYTRTNETAIYKHFFFSISVVFSPVLVFNICFVLIFRVKIREHHITFASIWKACFCRVWTDYTPFFPRWLERNFE